MPKGLTHEEFMEKFNICPNADEYTVLGKYINRRTDIKLRHNCGFEYDVRPDRFTISGNRCPKCSGVMKKTTEIFKEEVSKLDSDYEVLGEYVNDKTKILMKHIPTNLEFEMRPKDFLDGKRPQEFAWNHRKTTEEFKARMLEKADGFEYELLEEYGKNNKTPLLMKHINCDTIFKISPYDFNCGKGCPYCTASRGEKIISVVLNKHNIQYETQKRYDNLFGNSKRLKFDFFIEKFNLLIEYDGEWHFDQILENQDLKKQQEYDLLKNNYCIKNNINLIRIPYWEFYNIEKILEKILNYFENNNSDINEFTKWRLSEFAYLNESYGYILN